ncbi:MAG: NAD(P)/FAD-dependent oxidoreductase [Methyloligellaceae bacterium]
MKAGIVIVGGGIMGSAAAYFLACDGRAGDIVVIEPDPTYARAATPQGAGGCRQLFSRPENVQMSAFSLNFYKDFNDLMSFDGYDAEINFRDRGYLFTVGSEGAATLEKNTTLQHGEGARVELLDPADLAARFPSIGRADVALACYAPDDGWIDPHGALQGFRKNAERLGVRYVADRVCDLEISQTGVACAKLEGGGGVSGDMFLNTAGAWAAEIAAMVGVEVPVQPMCRVQHYWLCDAEIEPLPLIKDESGMFFRAEGEGWAGGRPSFDIAPGFVWDVDRGFFANYFEETVWPLIANRVPKFESIKLQSTWGGHYAQNTFDGNMIIGPLTSAAPNFIAACGFSGHGIMHAPAVGRALAELVLEGRYQSIDLARMEFRRVLENTPYPELGIV